MPAPALSPSSPASAISRHEIRIGQRLLLVFLLLISLPYAWAALLTPPGLVWGGLLFSADDQNVHLMWARQAHDGAFFFRDLYTTEGLVSGEKPLFWNILPWLMGIFSRFSGLEVGIWYHIFRVALAAIALWQLHGLSIAVTCGEERFARARLWTLALAVFTTGAGFLATLVPPLLHSLAWLDRPDSPFTSLVPEAFFVLSAFAYPLNIASFALLAFIFRHLIEGRGAGAAFVGALLLSNIHTYDALPLMLMALAWGLWRFKSARGEALVALAAFLGALLPVAYQFVVFRGSEEFRIKALTITAPPLPQHLIATFLPLLVLAVWGWQAAKELPARRLLLVWFVATLALVYAPTSLISFTRKMIEGLQLPLLVLGGLGLAALSEKLAGAKRDFAAGAVVAVLAISPFQTIGWIMQNAAENNASRLQVRMPPLYLAQNTVEALRFLNKQPQGVVLCLPFVGSYIPRSTGKYTYLGHWAETLKYDQEKWPNTTRFLSGKMSRDEAQAFFKTNRIRYFLETPFERYFAKGALPAQSLGLKPIFTQNDPQQGPVTLYEVPESF